MTRSRNNQGDLKGRRGHTKVQRITIRSKISRKLDPRSHDQNSKSFFGFTHVPVNGTVRSADAPKRLTLQIGSQEFVWTYRVTDEVLLNNSEET